MLESEIIAHCAPTLAGLKTANMFSYKPADMELLEREIRDGNEKLNGKGVFIDVLKTGEARVLVYVYRKKRLQRDLCREEVRCILADCGYEDPEPADCIRCLKRRFSGAECFPHEVGLFLGYPLSDVVGFIEQKGKNYKCAGIWKVYGNEEETRNLFRKLKRCTDVYIRRFAKGASITKLTVAA